MKRGIPTGPILLLAAVILAVGLGVIVSSFFREVAPRFAGDMAPLLRTGVLLFFIGAAYFLVALVSLFLLKPSPPDEESEFEADGVDTRITLRLKDPATHVASSILILVGSAVLLTVSLTRPSGPPELPVAVGDGRPRSEETMETRTHDEADNPLAYYASHGIMTDPGPHAHLFDGLPRDVEALTTAVQGLLLHVFWAEAYGVTLTEERQSEVAIRSVSDMLARIRELDGRPLAEPRELDAKLVGNCRDHAVLLTAMLRRHGVPARARCGFGAYFKPGEYMDHWVCEYWDGARKRWVLVDAQLDDLQVRTLGIEFDPLDVPRDQFITGGEAWLTCRAGRADPGRFGIMELRGMSFVRGNVGHDLWALNKVETLPWEGWGIAWVDDDELKPDDLEFLDRVARLTCSGDESFAEVRALCEEDARLKVPDGWPAD
jgi:hypothetical protein